MAFAGFFVNVATGYVMSRVRGQILILCGLVSSLVGIYTTLHCPLP